MSKELSPLEAFEEIYYASMGARIISRGEAKRDFKIIETALKRLEQYENETQSIGEMIAKKIKALEIIKKKQVCVAWLRNGLSAYNSTAALYELPRLAQEEYDLLKEVLL